MIISRKHFSHIKNSLVTERVGKLYNVGNKLLSIYFLIHYFQFVIFITITISTPVTPRKPTRLTTTNAVEINMREWSVNTCLGTTFNGSN